MKQRLDRETVALRVARDLPDGAIVNLGVGIGGTACNYISEGKTILFQSENGLLGFGTAFREDEMDQADLNLVNAQSQFVRFKPGMSVFDSGLSFDMIIGGHIDITVLGAYEVSEKGDLANWVKGGGPPFVGGGMDLAFGAKRVWVAMQHTTKGGEPKIVKKCSKPLTRKECVSLIVTDLAVIDVTPKGLLLKEIAPGWTVEEVQALTEPRLVVSEHLKEIEL